jgi:hypothetical protein
MRKMRKTAARQRDQIGSILMETRHQSQEYVLGRVDLGLRFVLPEWKVVHVETPLKGVFKGVTVRLKRKAVV